MNNRLSSACARWRHLTFRQTDEPFGGSQLPFLHPKALLRARVGARRNLSEDSAHTQQWRLIDGEWIEEWIEETTPARKPDKRFSFRKKHTNRGPEFSRTQTTRFIDGEWTKQYTNIRKVDWVRSPDSVAPVERDYDETKTSRQRGPHDLLGLADALQQMSEELKNSTEDEFTDDSKTHDWSTNEEFLSLLASNDATPKAPDCTTNKEPPPILPGNDAAPDLVAEQCADPVTQMVEDELPLSPLEVAMQKKATRRTPKRRVRLPTPEEKAKYSDNPWAQILARPIRHDNAGKLWAPLSLLVPLGVVRNGSQMYLMPDTLADLPNLHQRLTKMQYVGIFNEPAPGEAGLRVRLTPSKFLLEDLANNMLKAKTSKAGAVWHTQRGAVAKLLPFRWFEKANKETAYNNASAEYWKIVERQKAGGTNLIDEDMSDQPVEAAGEKESDVSLKGTIGSLSKHPGSIRFTPKSGSRRQQPEDALERREPGLTPAQLSQLEWPADLVDRLPDIMRQRVLIALDQVAKPCKTKEYRTGVSSLKWPDDLTVQALNLSASSAGDYWNDMGDIEAKDAITGTGSRQGNREDARPPIAVQPSEIPISATGTYSKLDDPTIWLPGSYLLHIGPPSAVLPALPYLDSDSKILASELEQHNKYIPPMLECGSHRLPAFNLEAMLGPQFQDVLASILEKHRTVLTLPPCARSAAQTQGHLVLVKSRTANSQFLAQELWQLWRYLGGRDCLLSDPVEDSKNVSHAYGSQYNGLSERGWEKLHQLLGLDDREADSVSNED